MFDVCTTGDTAHIDTIFKFLPYTRQQLQFHHHSDYKRSYNLHETYQCRMYSRKLLMMGREDAQTCRVL